MITSYSEKKEFLEHCQDLAMNLESKTDRFIEIQIGWIERFQPSGDELPVTIMLNHKDRWFGTFEKLGWNSNVIFDNIGRFTPVQEDYLVLNRLIDEVYK